MNYHRRLQTVGHSFLFVESFISILVFIKMKFGQGHFDGVRCERIEDIPVLSDDLDNITFFFTEQKIICNVLPGRVGQ